MFTTVVSPEREVLDLAATLRDAGARLGELVADGALAHVAEAALPDLVLSLQRAVDPVAAAVTTATARIHATGMLPEGQVSVSRWLQSRAGLSSGDAGVVIARGRAISEDYVATGLAWLSGRASGAQARAITTGVERAIRALPAASKDACRAEGEAALLAVVDIKTPDELTALAKRLRFRLDPDGTDQAAMDAYDAQQIVFTPIGDGVQVSGFLSAETAAVIQTALDKVVDGWFRTGALAEEDRTYAGCDAGDPDSALSRRARRIRTPHLHAIALAELCGTATESGSLGTKHGQTPRAVLVADLSQLDRLGADLGIPGIETPQPVGPQTARRMLCDCVVTTIVEGGPGVVPVCGCLASSPGCDHDRQQLADVLRDTSREILWAGREQRTIPPRIRRALERRDRHCAFPGCRVVVGRCHAHHVQHWENGGPTDLDNLVLICSRHHHAVHEGGWTVVPAGDDPRQQDYWCFLPPPSRRP
jgi:hypothetical protein